LSETYAYDRLGNLRVKAGVGYEYPAARQPRPHAPIRVGGQPYAYDANGNLTSGGGRTFVWNGWNQLASVSQAGVTETYAYDAAGARVTRTSNGATIVTVADLWERTVGGATTHFYRFGADVIGVRRSDQGTQYLFSDHLGSVSAATNASGALVGMQHYDPWGRVRTGGIGLTARTFTGQRLDATGLLYYHARYYDPTLGRFISPDSIVPEPGNPQSFNRFAYVYNNPLKYTDPTGHWIESAVDIAFIAYDIWDIHQNGLTWDNGLALAADVGGLLLPGLTGVGMVVRAATHADDVAAGALHAAAHADDVADAARAAAQGGEAADAARAATQGGEAADAARAATQGGEAAVHGAGQPHKNANHAVSHFGIYEIKVNGETYKFGKADLDRVTQSSGLPTRLHQQVRRLSKTYDDVRPEIVDLGYITTQQAKQAERAALQRYYETTRRIPPGNQKSFRPD
jgi:RHS repeat-associated protein